MISITTKSPYALSALVELYHQDVNAAADALLAHAKDYDLRTRKIVVLGHSAGGQLALWLTARGKLRLPVHSDGPIRRRSKY